MTKGSSFFVRSGMRPPAVSEPEQSGRWGFFPPDTENFPALGLAMEVLRRDAEYGQQTGSTLPVVYNAANEWAVARFLQGIGAFTDIADAIADAVSAHTVTVAPTLAEVLAAEQWTVDFLAGR